MPICTRTGCGKSFDETDNNAEDCKFHPGAPIFHEGLKGYSCCKKRVTSFEEFLGLPGCTTGSHSSEQVAKPAPVSTSATTEPVSAPTSIDGTVETYGTSQRMVTTPIPTPVVVEEKKSEPLEQDDPSIPVEKGTKCKRKGCNAVYVSDEVSRNDGPEAQCVFHPGPPLFHEGSKGYTCCKRKVLEFDEYGLNLTTVDSRFLKIPGCTTSAHRFVLPPQTPQTPETTETVQCREDFYQTQQTCVLAVFAKKIDKSSLNVTFSPREIIVEFTFDPRKRYSAKIPLYEEIDPENSRYEVLSTKLEITLKKANGASWPVLRPDPNVTEKIKFGVDSRGNAS